MKRRDFLGKAASAAGMAAGAAAMGACAAPKPTPTTTPSATASPEPPPRWFKDPTPFIEHGGKNLETKLEDLRGFLTPNELFFVRNNCASLALEKKSYRLKVGGDAAGKELELSFDQLLELPSRTVFSLIECGGNQRAMFDLVGGKKARGTQWKTGGVGNACWTGVPLLEVLKLADIKAEAVDVLLVGLDEDSPEGGFQRAMPVSKAMHPDTLLAYQMNGADLPKDHGFPLRAVVPGWVGSSSIKWLGRIEISSKKLWTRNNTVSYTLVGEAFPPVGEAEGQPIYEQSIKSALALPWPAQLKAGQRRLTGYAHSAIAEVAKVEWSDNGGKSWQEARLFQPQVQYSWACFELFWQAQPGEHQLMTRATDKAGNTQPEVAAYNDKGYLFNQPLPHPIEVS